MQPITRPRNITRADSAWSICAELTVASAQNNHALSTHLMLRSRVIDRIPTPDGTAPSRRPSARMRHHPPPPSPAPIHCSCARARLRICMASSAPVARKEKKKKKVEFATQWSRICAIRTDTGAYWDQKNSKKHYFSNGFVPQNPPFWENKAVFMW